MGNAGAERALRSPLRVDVNPLVVAGGFCEPVNALLADGQPFAAAQVGALGGQQGLGTVEDMAHGGAPQACCELTDNTSPTMYDA
ncbi:hypothetical protein D3C76_790980 [compost metagenome]